MNAVADIRPIALPTGEAMVLAKQLRAGDVVTREGFIDLHVTGIRASICGFVTVEYSFAGGACERGFVADQLVTIAPRVEVEAL